MCSTKDEITNGTFRLLVGYWYPSAGRDESGSALPLQHEVTWEEVF